MSATDSNLPESTRASRAVAHPRSRVDQHLGNLLVVVTFGALLVLPVAVLAAWAWLWPW